MPINFFKENISFRFSNRDKISEWIKKAIRKEGKTLENLNYIFCSDLYLKKINKDYLNHNYFTDIITFDNSTVKNRIEGDIFISVDRVKINAKKYQTSFNEELQRVIIHGVLHLTGYSDKTETQKNKMREKENEYLKKLKS